MKKILYILFCITLISCNSKKEEIKEEVIVFSDNGTTIYESDIYEVINTFFEDNKYKNKKGHLSVSGFDSHFPYGFKARFQKDSVFSADDITFILQQIECDDISTFDLKQKYISGYKIISREKIYNFNKDVILAAKDFWEEFYKVLGVKELNYIHLPLFSIDKKTAFIYFGSMNVNDPFGGKRKMDIYKKENNKWIWYSNGWIWANYEPSP